MMIGRIYGTETEYGCLIENPRLATEINPDTLALLIKDHLFRMGHVGILDIHYRDWGEPPENGGFLFNGGRLYIDMGHLEYATPECASIWDALAYERAGDQMLVDAVQELGVRDDVSFIKNNIDHTTGATFGYHENYLMRRNVSLDRVVIPALLPFLVTRQIYAGSGRVGYHEEEILEDSRRPVRRYATRVTSNVPYQISQRADHIVTEAYQWVQFSRAIINTRDEPLADPNLYRRIHLLIGDSNMSEYATALRLGTTALVMTLIEQGRLSPTPLKLENSIEALRHISRDQTYRWLVERDNERTITALEVQGVYYALAERHLSGISHEFDWILREWGETLEALATDPMQLRDRLDWVAKKWLLDTFVADEGLEWDDPWLQSIDLEYHKIDPQKGLHHDLVEQGLMRRVITDRALKTALFDPPPDTRAKGRSLAMQRLAQKNALCIVDWDVIHLENGEAMEMRDPFETYESAAAGLSKLLSRSAPKLARRSKKRSGDER
jgi:proteasome accessory factor A